MSGTLRLRGAISGYSELQAPAVAADQTFVLPTAGGTLLTTDSPVPKLTLELGSASQPSLTFEGDTDTGLYSSGTNTLNLVTGGNNRLVLDGLGRVGINTTSPSYVLDVNGTFRVTGESQFDADIYCDGNPQLGVAGTALFGALITVRNNFGSNSVFRGQVVGSTDYKIDLRANGDAHFLGNVGIGETNPISKLIIKNTSSNDGIRVISSNTGEGFVLFGDTDDNNTGGIVYNHTNDALEFNVNNSERMRIDSSGNVGIGTTPAANRKVHIQGTGFTELLVEKSDATTAAIMLAADAGVGSIYTRSTESTTTAIPLTFHTGNDERMRIDSSGNVGIGATSPDSPFHVNSSTNTVARFESTDSLARIVLKDNSGESRIGTDGNNITFHTSSTETERMRIDSSGRLLVGTSSAPTGSVSQYAYLTVRANTSGSAGGGIINLSRGIPASSLTSDANIGIISFTDSTTGEYAAIKADTDGAPGASDYPGRLEFHTTADGDPSPTERLRIDSSGNVQIRENSNTVSTGASLYLYDLAGSATGSNSSGRIAFYSSDLTDGASIRAEIANLYENTSADSALIFKTYKNSLNERMRITSGGVINTFSTETTGVFNVRYSSGSGSNIVFACKAGATDTTTGSDRFRVRGDGDCENTNNSYGAISDIKLKENIVDANSQWSDIKALQVRNYSFKEETNYGTHTQIGLVAQEVETVSPGLVSESPDLDDDGNDLGTVTKSVNYSVLYMKAVKALQEAMERIETLEAEVAALKAQ